MTTGRPGSPSPRLDHDRYCTEILEQTRLLRATLADADLAARVPTCPGWSVRELAVHLGGAHRWVRETVRTRAAEEVPEDEVPGFHGPGDDRSPQGLDTWLAEGAELLVSSLREAGPDEHVWSWSPERHTGFWARRMTHETVVHRADVCAAVPGAAYEVAPDVAADCIDEWLWILDCFSSATEEAAAEDEDLRAIRERAGGSLHFHATDAPDAEWLIELTPDGIAWHRTHAKATVAVRGPLTDVLRVLHRRLPADTDRVDLHGDAELLRFWLDRTAWG